jgi:hypothetical protein
VTFSVQARPVSGRGTADTNETGSERTWLRRK